MLKRKTQNVPRRTNQIDHAFGEMVRNRRILAGLSQAALAKALGLAYQQVQKYERGSNRISVSRLFALAGILNTTPSALLRDLETQLGSKPISRSAAEPHIPVQKEALILVRNYQAIEDANIRKQIFDLTRTVATSTRAEDE